MSIVANRSKAGAAKTVGKPLARQFHDVVVEFSITRRAEDATGTATDWVPRGHLGTGGSMYSRTHVNVWAAGPCGDLDL